MSYVLPCIAADEEELNIIQTKLLLVALPPEDGILQLNSSVTLYGPINVSGMGLIDLQTEMGILQLKTIRNAIYTNSEVGKMIVISIKYAQMEASIQEHILKQPSINIPYLTATWSTSFCNSYLNTI